MMSNAILQDLLAHSVAKQSVTGAPASGPPVYGSKPPVNLSALDLAHRLGSDPENPELLLEAERFIDGRHRMPAGPCSNCGQGLSAYDDEAEVLCPVCGTEHLVTLARFAGLNTALTTWVTAAEVEILTAATVGKIKASRVRQWASRGRIHGINGSYRLVDVLLLAFPG